MRKRFIAAILAVGYSVTFLSLFPAESTVAFGGGSGVNGDPYLISTCQELQDINNNLSAYYKLSSDINCIGSAVWNSGEGFVPIGDQTATKFTGHLDGNYHLVFDLSVTTNTRSSKGSGLFGAIGSGGTVSNLGVRKGLIASTDNTGGIAGFNAGTISGSFSDILIDADGDYVGGIAGVNDGTIHNSYARGRIDDANGDFVGGLVGANNGTISDSFATGWVSNNDYVGGIAGYSSGGTLLNTASQITTFQWGSYSGGMIGGNDSSTITNTYWDADFGAASDCFVTYPGNIGTTDPECSAINSDQAYFHSLTNEPFASFTDGTAMYRENDNDMPTFNWYEKDAVYNVGFAGGTGSNTNPYRIENCAQLQSIDALGTATDKHFVLSNDIDCAVTDPNSAGFDSNGLWGNERGFHPIGTSVKSLYSIYFDGFDGHFDGHNYTISNIFIFNEDPRLSVGLFGKTGEHSLIENVRLKNTNVSSDGYFTGTLVGEGYGDITNIKSMDVLVHGSGYVGGMIGLKNAGTVYNVHASGDVLSTGDETGGLAGQIEDVALSRATFNGNVTGDNEVGGLIGEVENTAATIDRSSSAGSVTATGITAGGLVGITDVAGVTISKSFSSATVQSAGEGAGGLVGDAYYNDLHITDSYALGDVSGTDRTGGLIGSGDNTAVVTNSYSAGLIDQNGTNYGGFVGLSPSGATYTNSFWDTDASGITFGCNENQQCSGVNGQTTAQLKTLSTIQTAGWNTTDTWKIDTDANDGYPCLRWSAACYPATDTDGVSDATEDAAPNDGDANDDGIPDRQQVNVASYVNAITGKYVTVEVSEPCNITTASNKNEASNSLQDASYGYNDGLVNFTAQCATNGASADVAIYHFNTTIAGRTLRKFNASKNIYYNLADYGASLSDTTIDYTPAVLASYTVTDGAALDSDGAANSRIVDPVGLASPSSVNAPNTGAAQHSLVQEYSVIFFGFIMLASVTRIGHTHKEEV